jgi:hypothetical protein
VSLLGSSQELGFAAFGYFVLFLTGSLVIAVLRPRNKVTLWLITVPSYLAMLVLLANPLAGYFLNEWQIQLAFVALGNLILLTLLAATWALGRRRSGSHSLTTLPVPILIGALTAFSFAWVLRPLRTPTIVDLLTIFPPVIGYATTMAIALNSVWRRPTSETALRGAAGKRVYRLQPAAVLLGSLAVSLIVASVAHLHNYWRPAHFPCNWCLPPPAASDPIDLAIGIASAAAAVISALAAAVSALAALKSMRTSPSVSTNDDTKQEVSAGHQPIALWTPASGDNVAEIVRHPHLHQPPASPTE